ncbi:MalY/PatB family protein [Ureibacillus sp. FSL K6-8385]|uniref:cysteine-S-conjugate beta-lyase n=1 Tax=Ureibacillus terrenus TaxID=118246 RepID=A0A540V0E5_9BACL|nr:MalY/PatB family protein [Ureibacillus terrenus]MED3662911.1 pyridoxal phosphate-dependent aminotransferase [Ureibacillus terrenus]MED3763784.1 pyridoxal phosphate-dependent aminotransferase [Ureibacillus terrenus]TQE90240.1 pyridoxal phosphate-dependent aminotransferase [Ureibacillus terrenus]
MTINFDEIYERRNTNSLKWDKFKDRYRAKYNVEDADNVLPMWVADMDFAVPQVVIDAIKERLNHPIFGYSYISDDCKEAIRQWYKRRHNWDISKEALLFHSGVVPAIATVLETFTEPGDKVCISTPVYPPFFNIPKGLKRKVVECNLAESKENIYEYDFEKLEEEFKNGVKAYILCSPHNPGGVVWSEETLKKLIQLCIKYDVLLISDEIHADIVFDGYKHIPTMTVEGADQAKIVACIAPTKTFNLAGLHAAIIVAENEKLRKKLIQNKNAHGLDDWNALAAAGVQAVYEKGDEWLDEMIQYVDKNIDYLEKELNQIDGVRVIRPHATYLVWIDYRGTGLSEKEMMDRLLNKGKLALEPGTKYSEAGRGFLRMNLACPFATVKEGVERFKKALL